jgi:hypothetical protein
MHEKQFGSNRQSVLHAVSASFFVLEVFYSSYIFILFSSQWILFIFEKKAQATLPQQQ